MVALLGEPLRQLTAHAGRLLFEFGLRKGGLLIYNGFVYFCLTAIFYFYYLIYIYTVG
jgi:hypothetical protein